MVVEGQGAHPQAAGNRKHGWVCSADAGVCHAWKAAAGNSAKFVYQHVKNMTFGRSGLAHQPRREKWISYVWCITALNRRVCWVTPLHPSGVAPLPIQLELGSPMKGGFFSFFCSGVQALSARSQVKQTWKKPWCNPEYPRCAATPLGGRGTGSSPPSLRG